MKQCFRKSETNVAIKFQQIPTKIMSSRISVCTFQSHWSYVTSQRWSFLAWEISVDLVGLCLRPLLIHSLIFAIVDSKYAFHWTGKCCLSQGDFWLKGKDVGKYVPPTLPWIPQSAHLPQKRSSQLWLILFQWMKSHVHEGYDSCRKGDGHTEMTCHRCLQSISQQCLIHRHIYIYTHIISQLLVCTAGKSMCEHARTSSIYSAGPTILVVPVWLHSIRVDERWHVYILQVKMSVEKMALSKI